MLHTSALRRWIWILMAVTATLGLLAVKLPVTAELAHSSEGEVRAAWRRAQEIGQYNFSSELIQITHPGPALVNVGRGSETETLYMEGRADLPDDRLELALWQNAGNVDGADSIEVRVDGDRTEGRMAGGNWQDLPDFANAFAPARDLMGYLAGMRNVRDLGSASRTLELDDGSQVTKHYAHYAFEVDGPDFAIYMRDQMERYLIENGELPVGLSLSLAETYVDLTGEGEVWIGSDGLPRRIHMHLVYPEMSNGDWIEATVKNDFYGYPRESASAPSSPLARLSARLTAHIPNSPEAWQRLTLQGALTLGVVSMVLLLITVQNSRLLYAGVAITMVLATLLTPVLQHQQAYAFSFEQEARRAEQQASADEAAAEHEAETALHTSDWNPHLDPLTAPRLPEIEGGPRSSAMEAGLPALRLPVSAGTGCDPTSDADPDGDGLSDKIEALKGTSCTNADSDDDGLSDGVEVNALGTNPKEMDSDGDGIYDHVEVQGFTYAGKRWYSDPLNADTNSDGQYDGAECPQLLKELAPTQTCVDTDRDNVPDIFDDDDDGDGVPDRVDISPRGRQGSFDLEHPFSFKIESDQVGRPLVVDVQLRPTNPDHLTYAHNVLDWPSGDHAGQVQRHQNNPATFYTVMSTEARSADPSAANGDMRLIPMLEVRMSGTPLPLPLTTPAVTLTLKNSAVSEPVVMQHLSNSRIGLSLPTSFHKVTLGSGSCENKGDAVVTLTGVQGQQHIEDYRLVDVADGRHYLQLFFNATDSECFDLMDLPNGAYTDRMVDTAPLDEYGMRVQDTNQDGVLIVYAPLSVVPDETGGGRTAFSARLFYQQNQANWGKVHEMRLVWLLQMLIDTCESVPPGVTGKAAETWCDDEDHWDLNQTQVIHTYNDEWILSGVTVREDYNLDIAVVAPVDGSALLNENLWRLARGLEATFVTGRSSDGVRRDITVAEIARRFQQGSNASETERWGISNDVFNVHTYAFANQDEIARLATTHNRAILDAAYAHDQTPTLLYAWEGTSRRVNLQAMRDRGDGAATLRLSGTPQTTAVFQWMPYRYSGGEGWGAYPLEAYLNELGVALKGHVERAGGDGENPDFLRGAIAAAQMYSLSLINGVTVALPEVPDKDDGISDSLLDLSGDVIEATCVDVATSVIEFVEDAIEDNQVGELLECSSVELLGKYLKSQLAPFKEISQAFKKLNKLGKGIVIALAVAALLLLATLVVAAAVFVFLSPQQLKTVIKIMNIGLKLLNLIKNIVDAASGIAEIINGTANAVGASMSWAAVVGFLLSSAVAIGLFVAKIVIFFASGNNNISQFLTLAFSGAVEVFIDLLIAGIMLALTLLGLGLVVAILGTIDALIAAVCAILPEEWTEEAQDWVDNTLAGVVDICGGITGTLAKWGRGNWYSNVSIVTFDDEKRLAFTSFAPEPADPARGFAVDNRLKVTLGLENRLQLTGVSLRLANSWMTMLYFFQYNLAQLRNSSFTYVLSPSVEDLHENLPLSAHYNEWFNTHTGSSAVGTAEDENYDPGKWAIRRTASKALPITQEGLNRSFVLYLLEGYAVPHQECTMVPFFPTSIPVCWIRSEWGTRPIPVGESLVFDVFPASLDEFYALTPKDGGYALDWANHVKLSFPRLRDADGDGLAYDADPNDSRWDTDGDGLGDYFETQQGLVATSADGDGDGLGDRYEVLHGTDPLRRDTDGDGLTDKEELDGWAFVYDFNGGDPQTTWVTSDPLEYDTDGDGVRDDREKLFGFNPRVWSDPRVLDFEAGVYESDAPHMLLRFEDGEGSPGFADASGFGNGAFCENSACPALDRSGYHGYARDFDGVDDAVEIPAALFNDLQAGTLATWVYLDSNDEETLFAKQHDGTDAYGVLSVRYTPTMMGDLGRVYFHAKNGAALLQSTTTLNTGRWYHVAVTFDAGGACMHIDGVRENCVAGDHTIPDDVNVTATTLGAHLGSAGGRYLDGRLDEFAIFHRTLSEDEIRRLADGAYAYEDGFVQPGASLAYEGRVTNQLNGRYAKGLYYGEFPAAVQPPAPRNFSLQPRGSASLTGTLQVSGGIPSQRLTFTQVAGARITDPATESGDAKLQLHFEEGGGASRFDDSSGFPEYPASCSGSACPAAGRQGRYGYALDFAGDEYVTVPYAASLNRDDFTVAAWAKVTGGSGHRSVVTSRGSPARGYMLYASPQNTWEFWIGTGTEWVSLDGGTIDGGAWTHLAGAYNASTQTLSFFVDGELVASRSGVRFAPNIRFPLRVGAGATEGSPDFYFTGTIDEVHVYDRALDPAAVGGLYDAPVLWWKASNPQWDYSSFHHLVECAGGCPDGEGRFQDYGAHLRVLGRDDFSYPSAEHTMLDFSDGRVTVSAWVKPEASSNESRDYGYQAILGYDGIHENGTLASNLSIMRVGGVGLEVVTRFGNPWESLRVDNVMNYNKWNHVVVTIGPNDPQNLSKGYDLDLYVNSIHYGTQNIDRLPNARNMYIRRGASYGAITIGKMYLEKQCDCGGNPKNYYEILGGGPGAWWQVWDLDIEDDAPVLMNKSYSVGRSMHTQQSLRMLEHDQNADDVLIDEYDLNEVYAVDKLSTTFTIPFKAWSYVAWCGDDGAQGELRKITFEQSSVPFVGPIGEVVIYKSTLDAAGVDALYRARAGVLELPLDDAPGSSRFQDLTRYPGVVCSGNSCPVSGLRGRADGAVRFDGIDDRITLGNDGRFTLPNDFTFGAWILPTGSGSGGDQGGVLINRETEYQVARFGDGTIRWMLANDNPGWNWVNTGCTAPLDVWTHVAVTYEDGTAVTYKNGEACHTYAGSGAIASGNQEVWLGGRGWADQYFEGLMDDVALYRYAFDAAQVRTLYGKAPQFNLTLDEGSGATTFVDSAGGQNATCSGSCPEAGAKGRVGLAASFDGVADQISLPPNALNNVPAGTIATWVYLEGNQEETLVARYDGLNHTHHGVLSVGYAPGLAEADAVPGRVYFRAHDDAELLASTTALNTGEWHHVAVTFNESGACMHVNGQRQHCAGGSHVIGNSGNATLALGAHPHAGRHLHGRLDEFAVYHRVLDQLEIKRLYDAQNAWVEERQSVEVVVDADAPISELVSDARYVANHDTVLQLGARDPVTVDGVPPAGVDRVLWRVDGGAWREAPACRDAEPGTAWCPTFDPTSLGEGAHTLETQAYDRVYNQGAPSSDTIYVDGTSPVVGTGIIADSLLPLIPHPDKARAQAVVLSGSVSDPNLPGGVAGSGVAGVEVVLLDAAGSPMSEALPATVHGNVWSVAYPLDEAEPTGSYTLRVTVTDAVGNSAVHDLVGFGLDASAPSAILDAGDLPTATLNSSSGTLHGVVSEVPVVGGAMMHLMFEEAAGATAFADRSGQSHTGSCSGSSCPTAGESGSYGHALVFDGLDDYVRVEDFGNFTTASVSAWVYRTGETDGRQVLVSYKAYSNCGFALLLNEGNRQHQPGVLFNVDGTWQYVEDATSIPLHTWVHLAATYDGGTIRLYRDGVQVAELAAPGKMQQCAQLTGIGAQAYGGMHFFPGRLDEVRIFDHALHATEVERLAQSPVNGVAGVEIAYTPTTPGSSFYNEPAMSGQVLHLPFDDQSTKGGTLNFRDITSPAQNGTCRGAACPATGVAGMRGTAVSFDGVDDAVRVENFGDFTTASASAWVYRTGETDGRQALISYKGYSNCGFALLLNEGNRGNQPGMLINVSGTWQYVEDEVPLPLRTWVHLAATYDGATLRLYRDGEQVAALAAPGAMEQCTQLTGIGAQPHGDMHFFPGALDDVRVFDRAITASEVKALWRGSDPLLHLTFDDQRVIDGPLDDSSAWGHDGVIRTTVFNAAIGKPAIQSSCLWPDNETACEAGKAVDGNTSGNFQDGSVTHTDIDRHAWWQVDLGYAHFIDAIDLWNRTDCCGTRLSGFYVFVSDQPFTSDDPAVLRSDPKVWHTYHDGAAEIHTSIPVDRSGQYVRVQLAGKNFLSLAEVQIWVPPAEAITNLAEGQEAFQSSNYWPDTPDAGNAMLAADGDTNGDFADGSVSHTMEEYRPWWQVDLGDRYWIDALDLWNRTDCCGERLNDVYVLISDTPFAGAGLDDVLAQPGVWSYHHAGAVGTQTSISVKRMGRYVRVQLAGTNTLSLAEVQVWGYNGDQPLRTVAGQVGNGALVLDGGNDYVALPDSALNDLVNGTIAAWIYLDRHNEETILAKQHDGAGSYGVLSVGYSPQGTGDAGRVYFHAHDGAPLLSSNTTLATGEWHHVAVTFDNTGACVYLNGVQDACRSDTRFYIPDQLNATATALGAWFGGGRHLDGRLDDVRIYPRTLSVLEVASLAQSGWQPVTVDQQGRRIGLSTWSTTLPGGLEGSYQIDVRGSDVLTQRDARLSSLRQWEGSIDTLAPRIDVHTVLIGSGPGSYTNFFITVEDFNLTTDGYVGPCQVSNDSRVQHEIYTSPWYLSLAPQGDRRLYKLHTSCQLSGDHRYDPVTFCDTTGNCGTVSAQSGASPLIQSTQSIQSVPPLDAVVLTPTHGSAVTTLDPITLDGAAYAQDGLGTLTVTVDGGTIHTQTWPPGVLDDTWSTTWTPTVDGVYRIEAMLRDQNGLALTVTHPITLYVDTAAPSIAIDTAVLTSTHYQPNGFLSLRGTVDDAAGVASVEWRVDGGAWQPAQVADGAWAGAWRVGFEELPNGESYTLDARATDVAGHVTEGNRTIVADLVGPETVTLTQSLVGGVVTVTWTESQDPSGLADYELHWTTLVTGTPATLVTTHPAGSGGEVSRPVAEGTALIAGLASRDLYGNVTRQELVPLYADDAFTPDYVTLDADTASRDWQVRGCSQVGTDTRAHDKALGGDSYIPAQELYTSWNSDGLRLTWQGADWSTDGDLFIYLDTRSGGSSRAYNPYPSTMTNTVILLPAMEGSVQLQGVHRLARSGDHRLNSLTSSMAADYLVWVQDDKAATLLTWNTVSQTWQTVNEPWQYSFEQVGAMAHTDLYLPMCALGIVDPTSTSLSMVAFATEEDELRLWATMPPRNPINSPRLLIDTSAGEIQRFALLHAYTWPALDDGVCPNGRQAAPLNVRASSLTMLAQAARQSVVRFSGSDVRLSASADPAGITYSVLEDDLFNIMDDVFATLTDWDTVDAELCAAYPDDPECTREDTDKSISMAVTRQSPTSPAPPGSMRQHPTLNIAARANSRMALTGGTGMDFNAQDGLATLTDVEPEPLGDGERITYTFSYVNRGIYTSTGLTADIVTWGPVRLLESEGAVYNSSPEDGEWYALLLDLGDLGPGEALTATFTGVIDLNFDTDNNFDWATADVIFYDDTGNLNENQLDWLYLDHEVDQDAPSISLMSVPALIAPGLNTARGSVSDRSAVPTVTLAIAPPDSKVILQDCTDPTPEDGMWSCVWDAGAVEEADVVYLSAQGTDRFGQAGEWTPWNDGWYAFTVDATPPTLTLDLETEAALAQKILGPDDLNFAGILADNRWVKAVQACRGGNCRWMDVQAGSASDPAVYVYDDVPAAPLPIDASTACQGGSAIVRTFDVTETFTVAEVAVGLNLTHTYRYDVEAWLVAPSGVWSNIVWNGSPAENYDVLLQDDAATVNPTDKSDHETGAPYFDNLVHPDQPLSYFYGEPAQGTWQIILCDYFPEDDDGAYNRSRLIFTADGLPEGTEGNWSYRLTVPEGLDAVTQTLTLSGFDSVGNQTAPVTLTFMVDTVAPALTVTQQITQIMGGGAVTVMSGEVFDGSGSVSLYAVGETPDGERYVDPLSSNDGEGWHYVLQRSLPGIYRYYLYAEDAVGNLAVYGPYVTRLVALPNVLKTVTPAEAMPGEVVTYTFRLTNLNSEVAITGLMITDHLPAELTPLAPVGEPYSVLPDGDLRWSDLTLAGDESRTLGFTARVSASESVWGTSVVNTATFACDGATGPAGNAHLQVIAPTITIVEPPPHAFIETGGAPFTTVTVTVQTYVDLPDEGYWLLQRDGVQVSGPIFTYSTPLSLTLGTHVISATLYSAQDVRLGEDGVKVYVAEQWKHIFLPIIMQDAPSADWRGHLFLPIVIQE